MSGPKVVRVISREELMASGEALLARLDAAVAQWQRECAGNFTPADEQLTKARRDALEAILRNNRFTEFGQAASNEIGFLELDAIQRREKAAEAKAQTRARLSNGRELARTLLKSQNSLTEQIRGELLKATAGELTLKEIDSVLSKVKQSMFNQVDQKSTPEQKALASRLSGDVVDLTFEEWKIKTVRPDERLLEAFRHLSDLELIGDIEVAAGLSMQLSQIQSMDNDSLRQMRLDTLIMSIRNAKKDANAKAKLLRSAELLAAELGKVDPTSQAPIALKNLTWSESIEKLGVLIAQGEKDLGEMTAANAASARRRAVLSGLEKLGYELHEVLSTATTASGRLVVRSPGDNGYGVELVGGAGLEKLQVRSVAFGSSRDESQDIPEEQRWCNDFGKLQTTLQAQGCEIIIEKALGVGATPIKVLEAGEDERRRYVARASQIGRSR